MVNSNKDLNLTYWQEDIGCMVLFHGRVIWWKFDPGLIWNVEPIMFRSLQSYQTLTLTCIKSTKPAIWIRDHSLNLFDWVHRFFIFSRVRSDFVLFHTRGVDIFTKSRGLEISCKTENFFASDLANVPGADQMSAVPGECTD